jgi:hypothetical protein
VLNLLGRILADERVEIFFQVRVAVTASATSAPQNFPMQFIDYFFLIEQTPMAAGWLKR